MRCVRFEDLKTGFIGIGFINGDSITRVQGSLETYWQITEDVYRMDEVRLLAPCVPKQIICVSLNFRKRANEFGEPVPQEPMLCCKASHTVIGTGERIIWPEEVGELAYGVELAIVIKKKMKNVAVDTTITTIMQMMYLQAGDLKHLINILKKKLNLL